MRVRAYNTWQGAQQTLSKKREQEQKLTAAGKIEKLQGIKAEIKEVRSHDPGACVCDR